MAGEQGAEGASETCFISTSASMPSRLWAIVPLPSTVPPWARRSAASKRIGAFPSFVTLRTVAETTCASYVIGCS